MRIKSTGVILSTECELQLSSCTARIPSPITAVIDEDTGRQINVCRACLTDMIRSGEWELPGSRVRPKADILILNQNHIPQVVIEILNHHPVLDTDTKEWASRVHRNMIMHGSVPQTMFFLLILTNMEFHLWKNTENIPNNFLPDYSGSLREQLDKYLQQESSDPKQVVSFAVLHWLDDIKTQGYLGDVPIWLSETGLLNLLSQGVIQTGLPVPTG